MIPNKGPDPDNRHYRLIKAIYKLDDNQIKKLYKSLQSAVWGASEIKEILGEKFNI